MRHVLLLPLVLIASHATFASNADVKCSDFKSCLRKSIDVINDNADLGYRFAEKSLQYNPNSSDAYFLMANALIIKHTGHSPYKRTVGEKKLKDLIPLHDRREIVKYLKKSADLDKGNVKTQLKVMDVLTELGEHRLASEYSERAEKIDPEETHQFLMQKIRKA